MGLSIGGDKDSFPGGRLLACAAGLGVNFYVAIFVDAQLFMANVLRSLLGILYGSFANSDFLVYHRLLLYARSIFGERHSNFPIGSDFASVARRSS